MRYLTFLLTLFVSATAFAQLKIVTTTTDFADFARQIGKDRVTVHSVMKGPENLHNVLATPAEMLKVHQADLFVHTGLDAEPWRDNLLKGARNPKIAAGKPGNVDMSTGITLRDVPKGKIDRSGGDLHAYGDPHYSLSPAAAQQAVVTLVRAMADVDSANADFYRENAKALVTSIADTHREVREAFAAHAGAKAVTFHRAWGYFAESIGLNVVATIEPQPAITPSPAQVRNLVDLCQREGVKLVICETYNDAKLAQSIAEKIGGRCVVLPTSVNGVAEANSYQALLRHNVTKIVEAIGKH